MSTSGTRRIRDAAQSNLQVWARREHEHSFVMKLDTRFSADLFAVKGRLLEPAKPGNGGIINLLIIHHLNGERRLQYLVMMNIMKDLVFGQDEYQCF